MRYILLVLLLLSSLHSQTRSKVIMGTYATISAEEDIALIEDGFLLLSDVEDSLSTYKKNSTVSRLNRDKYVKLDNYTYEVLKLSKKYYAQSYGYFNVAVGNFTKDLYRFGQDTQFIPHSKVLKNTKSTFNALDFNRYEAILKDDIKLDFGGMGKGYGVDKVREHFSKNGVKKSKIALSGDIACLGKCTVYVQNPFEHDSVIYKLETKKKFTSISTSGSYNRYVKSQKNNHLINPHTKQNQELFSSITLISELPNSDIDAYATAASVMPIELSIKFLDSMNIAYILITHSKDIIISKNILEFCKLSQIDSI